MTLGFLPQIHHLDQLTSLHAVRQRGASHVPGED